MRKQRVFYTQTQGRLDQSTIAALGLPADASAYLCGPTQFMADMRDALVAAGLDPACIHSELFSALPSINPGVVGAARAGRLIRPRYPWNGTVDHLCPQWAQRQLVTRLSQYSRFGRGLRRANPFRLSKRRLSCVRDRSHRRLTTIHPAAAGTAWAGKRC